MLILQAASKTLASVTIHRSGTYSRGAARKLTTAIQRLDTDDARMSKIVVHKDTVYLSGLVDVTASDVVGQTKNVLAEVDELLAKAGTSKSNLLTASIWLKDIEADFQDMNTVWIDWLDASNKPVRATVQSPMASPKILVEIQVSAAK